MHKPPPKLFDAVSPSARALARGFRSQALWRELLEETESLLNARDGDAKKLTARMRTDTATRAETQLAADLVDGKIARPAHRPDELRVQLRRELVFKFIVLALKAGLSPVKILDATRKHFGAAGLSRTIVLEMVAVVKFIAAALDAQHPSEKIVADLQAKFQRKGRPQRDDLSRDVVDRIVFLRRRALTLAEEDLLLRSGLDGMGKPGADTPFMRRVVRETRMFGRTYEEKHWGKLSARMQTAHNILRRAHGLPPIGALWFWADPGVT
jgi:hypothetical protein